MGLDSANRHSAAHENEIFEEHVARVSDCLEVGVAYSWQTASPAGLGDCRVLQELTYLDIASSDPELDIPLIHWILY